MRICGLKASYLSFTTILSWQGSWMHSLGLQRVAREISLTSERSQDQAFLGSQTGLELIRCFMTIVCVQKADPKRPPYKF